MRAESRPRRPLRRAHGLAAARAALLVLLLSVGAAAAQKAAAQKAAPAARKGPPPCAAGKAPQPDLRVRINSVINSGEGVVVGWVRPGKGCKPDSFNVTIAKAPAAPGGPIVPLETYNVKAPATKYAAAALPPNSTGGAMLVAGVSPLGADGTAAPVVWSAPFSLAKCGAGPAKGKPSGFNAAPQGGQVVLWWSHPDNTTCVAWYKVEAFDASTPGATKPIASWVVQAPSPVAPQVSLVIDPASLGAAKLVTFSVGPRNGAPGKKLSAVGDAGRSAALRFAAPAAVGGKWSVCADAPPPALKADGIQIARTVDEAGPGPLTLRIPNPDPSLKACVTSYEVQVSGAKGASLEKLTVPVADPTAEMVAFNLPPAGATAKAVLAGTPVKLQVTPLSGARRGAPAATPALKAAPVEGGGLATCRDVPLSGIKNLTISMASYMKGPEGPDSQEVPAIGASWEVIDSDKTAAAAPCVANYTAEVLDAATNQLVKGCDPALAPPAQARAVTAILKACNASSLLPKGTPADGRKVKVRVTALGAGGKPAGAPLTSGVVRVFPDGDGFFGVCQEGAAPSQAPALEWVKPVAQDPKTLLVSIDRNRRESACVTSYLVEVVSGDKVTGSVTSKTPTSPDDWPIIAEVPAPAPGASARVRVTPTADGAAKAAPAAVALSPVFTAPAAGAKAPEYLVPPQPAPAAASDAAPAAAAPGDGMAGGGAAPAMQYVRAVPPAPVGVADPRFGPAGVDCAPAAGKKSVC